MKKGGPMNRVNGIILILFALLIMLCRCDFCEANHRGGYGLKNDPWGRLSYSVVTPHTRWSNPIPGEPIRIITIGTMRSMREMVELHQRLECEIIPIMTPYEHTFISDAYSHYTQEETFAMIEEWLKEKFDVILIGAQSWKSMPAKVRYGLLKKVNDEGAVLIYIWPNDLAKEMETILKRPVMDVDFSKVMQGILDWQMLPLNPL